jgi:hypothetical protein
MPVTKTAKRALRSSTVKQKINILISAKLDRAMRKAKKTKASKDILAVSSLSDIAAKKKVIKAVLPNLIRLQASLLQSKS